MNNNLPPTYGFGSVCWSAKKGIIDCDKTEKLCKEDEIKRKKYRRRKRQREIVRNIYDIIKDITLCMFWYCVWIIFALLPFYFIGEFLFNRN